MNVNPKTDPLSAPASDSSDVNDVDTTPITLRIPDLIFQLRFAIRTKQFDDVERVLVAREAQLKREVEKLREISDFESDGDHRPNFGSSPVNETMKDQNGEYKSSILKV
ncbi:myosin-4-like isoform X3 [Senna tora]|uniref:Myosin-4-like isoform X3 n=1 Tax=Senna tora TaxID=362788 RepID=A0A834SI67_9FABA|nr:myosin-4-like isoform X3 [Senna tora]